MPGKTLEGRSDESLGKDETMPQEYGSQLSSTDDDRDYRHQGD
jgi:hypothetical protein